jgi:hypothetical protein
MKPNKKLAEIRHDKMMEAYYHWLRQEIIEATFSLDTAPARIAYRKMIRQEAQGNFEKATAAYMDTVRPSLPPVCRCGRGMDAIKFNPVNMSGAKVCRACHAEMTCMTSIRRCGDETLQTKRNAAPVR